MELEPETTEVLQRLVRFNTVNPPGNERPAIEYLSSLLGEAGFEVELLGTEPSRPNLVASLSGASEGPVLTFLGHVDTVLADASEWRHDPWSGDVEDGYLWGRGALDMKSQVAAEAVAAVSLARSGWRPAHGALKLVFTCDEETGGDIGARWLCEERPDKVRSDMVINEGGGESFSFGGQRYYGVCCAEKGIFRFRLTARGAAGHASLPRTGDNALLKLGPVLERLGRAGVTFAVTEAPAAFLDALGVGADDPAAALRVLAEEDPRLLTLVEPMFGVTLTPTMVQASEKINVIPSQAWLKVDCRVPPGLGEDAARAAVTAALGPALDDGHFELDFTETIIGNASPVATQLMSVLERWVDANDPGARAVPVILPGFSDSRWFREAFPDCVAYGFFPQRWQKLLEAAPLVHNADERIDVRDLGFAAACYADVAREVLGG